jgi:hypothetical protein
VIPCPSPFGAALAKEGSFHECDQYFPRSAHLVVHDLAAPLDAKTETATSRVTIAKDLSLLRIDHVPIRGKLLGVWQAVYSSGVLDFKEMNRHTIRVPQN